MTKSKILAPSRLRPRLRLRLWTILLLAGASSLPAAPAVAQEPAAPMAPVTPRGGGFGAAGQIAISGELSAHFRKHSGDGSELGIQPAFDYFIAPNVSVGGVVGLTYASGNPSSTTIRVGARAGYNLNLVDNIGFWPMAGVYFSHFSRRPDSSNSSFLRVFAPFLYHLVPHLFVGLGPILDLELSGGGGNSYGLESTVGGWW
jgi:hypothetical protein